MSVTEVAKIIQREIPITKAMGISFESFAESNCLISVPLEPNHNHKGTAFGGSLYSASTAACYGILYYLQVQNNLTNYDLLLGSGEIKYLKPVTTNFKVRGHLDENEWQKLILKLDRQGFGKIEIKAHVFIGDETDHLCEFSGVFILKKT